MMSKNHLPLIGLAAVALMGCETTEIIELQPAQLEISIDTLEYGLVPKGERLDKLITISNSGDVPLGVESVRLASDLDPTLGHVGSFRLLYNCGDVEVPTLNSEDNTARTGEASVDTAETGDPGNTDTSDPNGGGGGGGNVSNCPIPPGGRLPIKARFQPQRAGQNWDAVIVTTFGENVEEAQNAGKGPEEIISRDLDNNWKMAYLTGEGGETTPRALVTPRTINYGFVFGGQAESRYISVRNAGDGELEIGDIGVDPKNCSPGFSIAYKPTKGSTVGGGMAKVIEIVYEPTSDRQAQCLVNIETENPEDRDSREITDVLLVANSGVNASNVPPRVVVHSPAPGYQHRGLDPLPLELTVFDPNEPSSGLYCKVRSNLQGIKDGRPALADCGVKPGNDSGHMVVPVPVDYYEPGLEVLLVRVTDTSGVTREASVPVLLNANFPATDDDGDGFGTEGEFRDCDDTNPNVYPFAAETFDGRDNDCDRLIDEGTDGFDDDGDGMSESQGDCNDANPQTYKGAPELRDQADNDCDGVIDENTNAFDDDGDGYTELERDCNDRDPTINPGADELCGDGVDNDCDQILDSNDLGGCVATDSTPMIIGGINLSRTSVEQGEAISAYVQVYEEDGDEVLYQWSVKDDKGLIDDANAPTINWQAPQELSTIDGRELEFEAFKLFVVASDEDGNQRWRFEDVFMYPEGDLYVTFPKVVPKEGGSCSAVPTAPVGFLAGFGLMFAALRRRRKNG